ncbi:MAG: bifunctional phosphopantothenoylcysteine decarboxylase/phosphopantothenate--cysteine ligase CoaBC [Bacteroidales bacterium]|nr:bifunctional phosphopantothenoylcysteine decarboxylase/phosphopantothenate--cysteine ligase CoaBC [Bacteroidales bacterium]
MLRNKKILLGITGSIAAYKAANLVRLFKKNAADVVVIMTPAAKDFISPLTLSTLSENPVLCEGFHPLSGKWNSHIDFGIWADMFIIAPASANTLAKMSAGIADNLLLTTYLSARCPVFFAPAMDTAMYLHPATQKNINNLIALNKICISPASGFLASGLTGEGRMQEPEFILDFVIDYFKPKDFIGKKILITGGPTHEKIDNVRFISNYSTGTTAYYLANEIAARGGAVTLISGPVCRELTKLVNNNNIKVIDVVSASQMHNECVNQFQENSICIMAAAVADYTLKPLSAGKYKKSGEDITLNLYPSKDILKELGLIKSKNQFLVGFALESENELINAKEKIKSKNLDLIILNSLKDEGAGFGYSTNKITIIDKNNNTTAYPLKSKYEVVKDIVDKISSYFI